MRRIHLLAVFSLIGGVTLSPLLSDRSAPSYQVVHDWPQLPDGFVFGAVAGVGVDSHNHVFVFHRGSRPILCLDGDSGKIVASWGDGMFGSAHGLDVDPQDNVWVTDTEHHQITKFSHDGELLMTLGAKGGPRPRRQPLQQADRHRGGFERRVLRLGRVWQQSSGQVLPRGKVPSRLG